MVSPCSTGVVLAEIIAMAAIIALAEMKGLTEKLFPEQIEKASRRLDDGVEDLESRYRS